MNEHTTQMVTSIFAAVAAIMAWVNGRANKKRIEDVQARVQEVHILFNSRLDEMMRLVKSEAHLVGMAEGVASEQARVAEVVAAGPVTVIGSPITVAGEISGGGGTEPPPPT